LTTQRTGAAVISGRVAAASRITVAQKIAQNLTMLGANRFDYGMGALSHQALVPRVRELLA
jgi:hypothetical protein